MTKRMSRAAQCFCARLGELMDARLDASAINLAGGDALAAWLDGAHRTFCKAVEQITAELGLPPEYRSWRGEKMTDSEGEATIPGLRRFPRRHKAAA